MARKFRNEKYTRPRQRTRVNRGVVVRENFPLVVARVNTHIRVLKHTPYHPVQAKAKAQYRKRSGL